MKKNSVKNERINEEVRKELAAILRDELKDPRVDALRTSIVECVVAPDLKTARVYVSVLGDEEACRESLAGLKSSAGFLRRRLAKRLQLRNTPELWFVADASIARGVDMIKKIDEVMEQMPERDDQEEETDGQIF